MTWKWYWFLFGLASLAFLATIEAYPSNELEGGNHEHSGKVKLHDLVAARGKKRRLENAVTADEMETEEILNAEPNSWNHKHVRAQSRPKRLHEEGRDPRGPIAAGRTTKYEANAPRVDRSKRNATLLGVAKKGHKKLKLALTRPGPKPRLGKTRSKLSDGAEESSVDRTVKKVDRRHAAYSVRDTPGRFRPKRYAAGRAFGENRADYYAQRRAVMERFYARQREISEKYARKATTLSPPKYIRGYDTTGNASDAKIGGAPSDAPDTGNDTRVDKDDNNKDVAARVSPTAEVRGGPLETTTAADKVRSAYSSLEENNEEDGSDDYDYYTLEESKSKTTTAAMPVDAGTLNDGDLEVYEEIKDPLMWGTCDGRLVYQHNVIITVHRAARADADIATSLEGPFCVTCFRVTPADRYNATASLLVGNGRHDGNLTSARIKVESFQDQTLVYTVKVWALPKLRNTCDHI